MAKQKLKKIDKIESRTTPDRKKQKNRRQNLTNMTPGSSGKKVKRIKECRIQTIKNLWENTDRKKDRKIVEKKLGIETNVKKIISGIEASIETGNKSSCSLKVLSEKVESNTPNIKIESHKDRKVLSGLERDIVRKKQYDRKV